MHFLHLFLNNNTRAGKLNLKARRRCQTAYKCPKKFKNMQIFENAELESNLINLNDDLENNLDNSDLILTIPDHAIILLNENNNLSNRIFFDYNFPRALYRLANRNPTMLFGILNEVFFAVVSVYRSISLVHMFTYRGVRILVITNAFCQIIHTYAINILELNIQNNVVGVNVHSPVLIYLNLMIPSAVNLIKFILQILTYHYNAETQLAVYMGYHNSNLLFLYFGGYALFILLGIGLAYFEYCIASYVPPVQSTPALQSISSAQPDYMPAIQNITTIN